MMSYRSLRCREETPVHKCITFIVTVILLLSRFEAAFGSLTELRDRWSLPDVPSSFQYSNEGFAPDGSRKPGINFYFGIPINRDVAKHQHVDIKLYDRGCKYNDGNGGVHITKGTWTFLRFPKSDEQDPSPFAMTDLLITLGNGEDGMNVASLLKEYPTLWDEDNSQISFCFRLSLQTEGIEVNFFESLVNMKVKMEGVGFEINEFSVGPKEKTTEFQRISFDVRAYMCDGFYRPFTEETTGVVERIYETCNDETGLMETVTETVPTETTNTEGEVYQQQFSEAQLAEKERIVYPQGSVLRVCIRPDDTALGKVSMRTIRQLYFEGTVDPIIAQRQAAFEPTTYIDREKGIYRQVAVEDGTTDASSGLSILSCENNRMEDRPEVVVCAVDTIIVAAFYWRAPGVVATVNVYGTAVLKFGADDVELDAKSGGFEEDGGTRRNLGQGNSMVRGAALSKEENKSQPKTSEFSDSNKSTQTQTPLPPPAPKQLLQQRMTKEEYLLSKYWNMTMPKVTYAEGEEVLDSLDFKMEYQVSDAIDRHMTRLEIWNKECEDYRKEPALVYERGMELTSMDLLEITSTDPYETGNGTGTQIVTVNGRWKRENPDFIRILQESEYFQETSDKTLVQISVCVRYQLHAKDEHGGMEVNFRESKLAINIDFKAGITFNTVITLISDEDNCLDDLQTLSDGKMNNLDDLFYSGLYWRSGSDPEGLPPTPVNSWNDSGKDSWDSSWWNSSMSESASAINPWGHFLKPQSDYTNPFSSSPFSSSHYLKKSSSINSLQYPQTMMVAIGTFILYLHLR